LKRNIEFNLWCTIPPVDPCHVQNERSKLVYRGGIGQI
jgi:hypothetical protein